MDFEITGNLIIKNVDEEGQMEALVTTYNNTDVVDDIVLPGALDDFISGFGKQDDDDDEDKPYGEKLPMLFQHNRDEIIGEWTEFYSTDEGVMGKGQIYLDIQRGEETRKLIQRGALTDVSIGFRAEEYEANDEGGYTFSKIYLMEVSVVDKGANPKAKITSIKNEDGSYNIRLLERILRDGGFSQKDAKIIVSAAKAALHEDKVDDDVEVVEDVKEVKPQTLASDFLAIINKTGDN